MNKTFNGPAKKQTYQKQIARLKETGYYGSAYDHTWSRELNKHTCCGAPRAYYHRQTCPVAGKKDI